MPNEKKFSKVTVAGKIQLGVIHELQQAPTTKPGNIFRSGGSNLANKYDQLSPENADTIGESLGFKFSDTTSGDLFIENSGMVTSFGIFGSTGSGKTVLLMHMLGQVFKHQASNPNTKYGALILDPKAILIPDITDIAKNTNRTDDLRIIGNGELVNVIDCDLDPYELGPILVLAARSAGIDASDAFWFQEWSNLFSAALSVLKANEKISASMMPPKRVTLKKLLDAVLGQDNNGRRNIQILAEEMVNNKAQLGNKWDDILIDVQQINRFYKSNYVNTIEAFIMKAFGMFRRSRNSFYSDDQPVTTAPFYEDIIENGRIVIISISPSEPVLAKTLCTLVKVLFQRTVLARGERRFKNIERPVVIACDEYSEIASEIPGQSMGDGQFLALARQYGCMAIFATQSVNVLEASSLKETWRSVFSNFAAKIYMRLSDNETAEQATKLAGDSDWRIMSRGASVGMQGRSVSKQRELRERKNLPTTVLTHVLKTGQAVVIGSLDGGKSIPGTYFISVPFGNAPSSMAASTRRGKTVNCVECKFYNRPVQLQLTSSAKANLKWEESREQRRSEEQRRVDENYLFHYKPEFFDWCSSGVPTPTQIRLLKQHYQQGNMAAIDQYVQDGILFTIDPSRGTVDPIYPLCIRINSEGNCPIYQKRP
jgi:hypothetical protein